jgi:hypothetical protein
MQHSVRRLFEISGNPRSTSMEGIPVATAAGCLDTTYVVLLRNGRALFAQLAGSCSRGRPFSGQTRPR